MSTHDDEKYCPSCNQLLRVDAFSGNLAAPDGLQGYCRRCTQRKARAYRRDNKEAHQRYMRDYMRMKRYAKKKEDLKRMVQGPADPPPASSLPVNTTQNPEIVPLVPRQFKTCRACGLTKPAADFVKRKASRDGRHALCRACLHS
jgi:hypothetical protein